MARRLDYSARYPLHTTKELYAALTNRDYWEARMEEMRKYSPNEVISIDASEDGINVVLHHILPRDVLPEIAQSVMRKDMVITRKESFGPFGPEVDGRYSASIPAGPGSLTGTISLFPTETGCTMRMSSEAKVFIPMVGPRLEQLMLVNLVDLFRAEAEVTQKWLDEHKSARLSVPLGTVTRGTTGTNRLRRSDRQLVHDPRITAVLRGAADPLVVDLGYGAQPWTTLELADRLRTVRPDIRVVGLEIDPARVVPARDGVVFARGGFELAGLRPILVRAFNVLRQYPETSVAGAWQTVLAGLAPGGLLVEGTCDELGRRCAWVVLDHSGPRSLTLAWDPLTVARPSDLAERLPKALIHRNIPGERIHALLTAADRAWAHSAALASYGPRVRWRAAGDLMREQGFPVRDFRRRLRDNILEVPWSTVAPA